MEINYTNGSFINTFAWYETRCWERGGQAREEHWKGGGFPVRPGFCHCARGLYFLKNNTNGKKEVIKIEQMVRKRRKPLVKKHKSIQEICRLARKNGMSYGEYVSKTKQ